MPTDVTNQQLPMKLYVRMIQNWFQNKIKEKKIEINSWNEKSLDTERKKSLIRLKIPKGRKLN